MSSQLATLRSLLEERFPDALPVTRGTAGSLATGISALDRALPGTGLPRGRLVAWAPGGGATAVLRSSCRAVVARGERAAWVDGARMATGRWTEGLALFRPSSELVARECAEELVRSGGFALVVLSGTHAADAERVRFSRMAKEGGAALVLLEERGFMASVQIASTISPAAYRWRRNPFGEPAVVESVTVRARVAALGWSREAEFLLSVSAHELPLSLEPSLVDRRGTAR